MKIKSFFTVFLIGIICIAVGSFIAFQRRGDYEKVEAEIARIETGTDSDGNTTHDVFVNYEAEGTQFRGVHISSYDTSMYEGKKITIEYRIGDPSHTRTGSSKVAMIILFCIGGLALAYGIFTLVLLLIKSR